MDKDPYTLDPDLLPMDEAILTAASRVIDIKADDAQLY